MPEMIHEHWWSEWYPETRVSKYRYCQHKDCDAVEKQEALG